MNLGYPRQTPERRLRGGGVPSALISDELAMWVDHCVAGVQPQRARDAVVLWWVCNATQRRLCRDLRCRHTTAQQLLDDAHSQIAEEALKGAGWEDGGLIGAADQINGPGSRAELACDGFADKSCRSARGVEARFGSRFRMTIPGGTFHSVLLPTA